VVECATREGVSAPSAVGRAAISPDASAAIEAFRGVLGDFAKRIPDAGLPEAVKGMLAAVNYKAEVDRCYPDAIARQTRWAAVEEVLNIAENYQRRAAKPTLGGFLEDVALSAEETPEEPGDGQPREAVTLMTLHAAKGLEFPRVYLVGCEEGLLPHARSVAEDTVEEERRLMYVGITRAMRLLTVTRAKSRAKYGRREGCVPSRFLFEMRGEKAPAPRNRTAAPSR
jgi:DNA helicase-2/ATP-dependent DNA helicase PcrA